jgi:hypothetical protein
LFPRESTTALLHFFFVITCTVLVTDLEDDVILRNHALVRKKDGVS